MVTAEASQRLPRSETQWQREVDRCRAEIASAEALLRRNLLIYGAGGIVVPFVGIKIIDVIITAIGLA